MAHVSDYFSQAQESLRGVIPSDWQRYQLVLAILAWGKISPDEHCCAASTVNQYEEIRQVLIRALAERLQTSEQQDLVEVLSATLILEKIEQVDPVSLARLKSSAKQLARNGYLASPAVDDLLPRNVLDARGQFVIPPELAQLFLMLGQPSETTTVYTPWDGLGYLAAKIGNSKQLAYIETPAYSAVPHLIRLLTSSGAQIHFNNPILNPSAVEGGALRRFDLSLAFPPIGIRFNRSLANADKFERFPEITTVGTVLFVRHLLAQTKDRVVVAVPNSLLFSSGSERALRHDLIKKGILKTVIAMPLGLLEDAGVGLAILVLEPEGGHKSIRFIDGTSPRFFEQVTRTQNRLMNVEALANLAMSPLTSAQIQSVSDLAVVPVHELAHDDLNLQVSRFVMAEAKHELKAHIRKFETTQLKDIVSTLRPLAPMLSKAPKVENATTSTVFEVGTNDLQRFGFISAPSRHIEVPDSLFGETLHQFLRPLDIVLITKGGVGRVGIVSPNPPPSGPGGWVAGQSAIILRTHATEIFDPRALFMLLRSPIGQAMLNGIVSDATTPLIQLRELLALEIPLPSLEQQNEAIDSLSREHEIQTKIEELRTEQAQVATDLWQLT